MVHDPQGFSCILRAWRRRYIDVCQFRGAWWGVSMLAVVLSGCADPGDKLGPTIYRDGVGANGPLAYRQGPRWLAMGQFGCATCHGVDGRGLTVRSGSVVGVVPPITAAVLDARGYDTLRLRRAIVEGMSADGRQLSDYMPRWQIDEREMAALLDVLAGL